MAKTKADALKRPPGLNSADKAALSRILKKARAHKAFYRAQSPALLNVPAKRNGAGGRARGRKAS